MDHGLQKELLMDTSQFISDVRHVRLDTIEPSSHNPRGSIQTSSDDSFDRLVSSVHEVGLLVPLVISELKRPKSGIKYQLVDGERRFWAAKALGLSRVPAHVLASGSSAAELRKLMFHLHMTREQWKPLQQCRSLAEAYPPLAHGLRFDEKPVWAKRLSIETGMPSVTARDRVHVLCWSKELKDRVFKFDEKAPKKDIYSYILAIEASVVEPSVKAFPDFYNHGQPSLSKANRVRDCLLTKTINGFETGAVSNREQIRAIAPLFVPSLPLGQRRIAQGLFTTFLKRSDYQFDDVKAEIDARLPGLAKEKVPKPQKLIAMIKSLQSTLQLYSPTLLDNVVTKEPARRKIRRELLEAIDALAATLAELQERFRG
jgi:hypothetical protein